MTTRRTELRPVAWPTPAACPIKEGSIFIAIQMFLEDRRSPELSSELTELYENELTTFLDYCAARGASKLTDINCRLLRDYRLALDRCRKPSGVLAARCTLDVFLDWIGMEGLVASGWEESH